jgi:hypothetical protein
MSPKVGNLDTLRKESSNLIPPKVEPLNTPNVKYAHYTLLYAFQLFVRTIVWEISH